MTRVIWTGEGELPDDAVYFSKRDGTLVGRRYLRIRARIRLGRCRYFSTAQRRAALARTIDRDEWLAPFDRCLVSYILGEVVADLYGGSHAV